MGLSGAALLLLALGLVTTAMADPVINADTMETLTSPDAVAWGKVNLLGVDIQEGQEFSKPTELKSTMGGCLQNAVTGPMGSIFVTCRGHVYLTGEHVNVNGDYTADGGGAQVGPLRGVDRLVDHYVVMAAGGDDHYMVLTDKGKVFSWGNNKFGQLGLDDAELPHATSPTEIEFFADKNIRYITAKGFKSAAITDTGALYIWGEHVGPDGAVDYIGNAYKPHLVQSLEGTSICQFSMGDRHVAALSRAGNVYEWGDGTQGQLGQGDFNIRRSKPSVVNRLRKDVCHVEAAFDYTVAITQDERMFLWGSNGYSAPFEKVWLQGLNPVQAGAGKKHIVVLLGNGKVVTWGSSKVGQIGRDTGDGTSFTLAVDYLEWGGDQVFSQLAVGGEQTLAIASGIPTPSLCACNGGKDKRYKHWFEETVYEPQCTDEQTACGDGSCCGKEQTCCRVDDAETDLRSMRSVVNQTKVKSSFACVNGANAVCCGQTGKACPVGFKCNLDIAEGDNCRCEPDNKRQMTEKQLVMGSAYCEKQLPGRAPPAGKQTGLGSCGARKTTCPDETCCPRGFSCCPTHDGYGCCQILNGVCCKKGCCMEGYQCDDSPGPDVCRKIDTEGASTAIVLVPRGNVEGQCGPNKRRCPDSSCCKGGKSCCLLSDGSFGCCPFLNGVCCADGAGCCPGSYTCDTINMLCNPRDGDPTKVIEMATTPRNNPVRSEASVVRCNSEKVCTFPGTCSPDEMRCCPFNKAEFCSDGVTCCPQGYKCGKEGNSCESAEDSVPRKLTRTVIAYPTKEQQIKAGQITCGADEKVCEDSTCCKRGTKCCVDPNGGGTHCCAQAAATCCQNGCCAAGHHCDDAQNKCVFAGESYKVLPWSMASVPSVVKATMSVSAPGKCYTNERVCPNGECCPHTSTCCNFGLGEFGCCPQGASKCCVGGGCCPGSAECPQPGSTDRTCIAKDGSAVPQISGNTPNSPSVEFDVEECWQDESTCFDGGCCKTESSTCCSVTTNKGPESVCCGKSNAVCCENGGCCSQGEMCTPSGGCVDEITGEAAGEVSQVTGPDVHPLSPLAEKDCPDSTICAMTDTCCSLGYDPEWDEEVFACCPFEDAICCTEFEGCCPQGFMCDAETQDCVQDGRLVTPGENGATEPPPPFMCELPLTQCPSGKCCEEDEICVPLTSGNFKCVERGFVGCTDGRWACPEGLWCDMDEDADVMMCSKEVDTSVKIKESLLAKYWGDDVPSPGLIPTVAPVCDSKMLSDIPKFLQSFNLPLEGQRTCGKLMDCISKGNTDCQFCDCMTVFPFPAPENHPLAEVGGEISCRPTDAYPNTLTDYYQGCNAHRVTEASAAGCAATCALQSLLQTSEGRKSLPGEPNNGVGKSHSPQVTVDTLAPSLFWYPKTLTHVNRAKRVSNTSLPTVQVGRLCQHFGEMRQTPAFGVNAEVNAETPFDTNEDACFYSNLNGHFAEKERQRTVELMDEYKKRLCDQQNCLGTVGTEYMFVPEDLDPCPCREKPALPIDMDASAGSDDAAMAAQMEAVADMETEAPIMAVSPVKPATATTDDAAAAATEEEVIVADEKVGAGIAVASSSGGTPVEADPSIEVIEELKAESKNEESKTVPLRTLVRPTSDKMQLASTYHDSASQAPGDSDMLAASGKEAILANCSEDGTESAADLDGKLALAEDAAADEMVAMDLSLAQMNAQAIPAGSAAAHAKSPGKVMGN